MYNPTMLRVGLEVRTREGKTLGKIKHVGSGTFEVEKGVFFKRGFSVGYDEIARVEGDGVVVLEPSMDELDEIRRHGALGTTLEERVAGAVLHATQAARRAVHSSHAAGPKP
jgi:hypothetical protein